MSDYRITIRLSDAEHKALKARAAASGATVAETARALACYSSPGNANEPPDFSPIAEFFDGEIQRLESAVNDRLDRLDRTLSTVLFALEALSKAPSPIPQQRHPAADDWGSAAPQPRPAPQVQKRPAVAVPGRPSFQDWKGTPEGRPDMSIPSMTDRINDMRRRYEEKYGPI